MGTLEEQIIAYILGLIDIPQDRVNLIVQNLLNLVFALANIGLSTILP